MDTAVTETVQVCFRLLNVWVPENGRMEHEPHALDVKQQKGEVFTVKFSQIRQNMAHKRTFILPIHRDLNLKGLNLTATQPIIDKCIRIINCFQMTVIY